MPNAEMRKQAATKDGFIAALDQSGGSTPKALRLYGVEESAYTNDDEMFALVHDMRARIITAPAFNGDKVMGAILFEKTMDGEIDDVEYYIEVILEQRPPWVKTFEDTLGKIAEACKSLQ